MPVLRVIIGIVCGILLGIIIQQLGLKFLAGHNADAQAFWQFFIIPLVVGGGVIGGVVSSWRV